MTRHGGGLLLQYNHENKGHIQGRINGIESVAANK